MVEFTHPRLSHPFIYVLCVIFYLVTLVVHKSPSRPAIVKSIPSLTTEEALIADTDSVVMESNRDYTFYCAGDLIEVEEGDTNGTSSVLKLVCSGPQEIIITEQRYLCKNRNTVIVLQGKKVVRLNLVFRCK